MGRDGPTFPSAEPSSSSVSGHCHVFLGEHKGSFPQREENAKSAQPPKRETRLPFW